MKKLLIIITLLFSVNCYSQDTRQVQKHIDTTIVFNLNLNSVDSLVVKDIKKREKIRKRNRIMNLICIPTWLIFTIGLLIL